MGHKQLAQELGNKDVMLKTFVIVEDEGRFLLIREAAKKWNGKWFLPGGKVEVGEEAATAAKREVKEEAGYEVALKGIVYIRYHERLFRKQLSIFYCGKVTGGRLKTKSNKHSLEAKWFTYQQIKTLPLRQRLLEVLVKYQPKKAMPPENFRIYP